MAKFSATSLIECGIETEMDFKWSDFVEGDNGFWYGVPYKAHKVFEFNPKDKSMKEIGPDLGDGDGKFTYGIKANNGSIYCIPYFRTEYFLKITPKDGGNAEIKFIKDHRLPEEGSKLWYSGALAKDGCIYCMPYNAHFVLKLDPNNGDSLSLVGDDFGNLQAKYDGVVSTKDGCIYGIPYNSKQIIKFYPEDNSLSNVGDKLKEVVVITRGILAADENIYMVDQFGQILKIVTENDDYQWIGDRLHKDSDIIGWGLPVLGDDDCIYCPPYDQDKVLKFNLITQEQSLVGNSYESKQKWWAALTTMDGHIYCIPYNAKDLLQINTKSSFPSLINCDLKTDASRKWSSFVAAGNGFLYGIPNDAHRVISFNQTDFLIKEIGPNLGASTAKYWSGVRAKSGNIYCAPYKAQQYFLKIIPKAGGDAEVQILVDKELPDDGKAADREHDKNMADVTSDVLMQEKHSHFLWGAGALATDGCIYFMPSDAGHILKLDPNNGDSLSLVGDCLGYEKNKYLGAITGKDGYIYGIPYKGSNQIIKFHPADNSISKVGVAFGEAQYFRGGVLAIDGNIYSVNRWGQVLKIYTTENDYHFIGDQIIDINSSMGWGMPVLGDDQSIYCPPLSHGQVLKFNIITQQVSIFGDYLFGSDKWNGGAKTMDGYIYCPPSCARQVLQIDARSFDKSFFNDLSILNFT